MILPAAGRRRWKLSVIALWLCREVGGGFAVWSSGLWVCGQGVGWVSGNLCAWRAGREETHF